MKVAIIADAKQSKEVDNLSEQALGPAYVAQAAKNAGYDVTLFHKFPPTESLLEFDVVGFSANSQDVPQVLETSEKLKQRKRSLVTVVGGPHVSGEIFEQSQTIRSPKPLLSERMISYYIEREGEQVFVNLLESLKRGLLCFSEHSRRIENIDALPFPTDFRDSSTFKQPTNTSQREYLIPIIESRGCPGQKGETCKFCSSEASWGRQIRYRSGDNILKEVEEVVKTYNLQRENTRIFFDGLELMINRTNFYDLMGTFEKTRYELESCGDIRLATQQSLETMRRGGYGTIFWGIESLDEQILIRYKAGLTLEQIKECLEQSNNLGIKNVGMIMLGFPEETEKSILNWTKKLKDLPLDALRVSIVTPFPGTEFRRNLLREGYEIEPYSERYDSSHLVYTHPNIPKEKMEEIRKAIITPSQTQSSIPVSLGKTETVSD